ncbi:MAG: outer membrane protein assembly factor BamB family protein [Planctomycetota bacterium]|jgi:hypothetical protein
MGIFQPCNATSLYFVKFGTPVVSEQHIVFAGPGWQSDRVICISRAEGEKLWEFQDKGRILKPWFIMGERLVVTKDSDIYLCDLSSGELKHMYKSDLTRCSLEHLKDTLILLKGEKNDVDFLCCVDLEQAKELWRVSGVCSIIARSPEILCVQKGKRKRTYIGGYLLTDVKVCGLMIEEGKICWAHPDPQDNFFLTGGTQKDYFIVALSEDVKCYRQTDGKLMNSISFGQDTEAVICSYKSDVLACVEFYVDDLNDPYLDESSLDELPSLDNMYDYVVYSLSVPELKKKEVFKPDWYAVDVRTYGDMLFGETIGTIDVYHIPTGRKIWSGGQWNWSGIYDDFIFYSKYEHKEGLTTINQINVKTGERKRLYEEPLANNN